MPRTGWWAAPILFTIISVGSSRAPAAGATEWEAAWAHRDTVVEVWIPAAAATAGGRVSLQVRVDVEGVGPRLARIGGRLRFEPALLAYDGSAPVEDGVELTVDPSGADAGTVSFVLDRAGGGGPADTAPLVEVRFRVVGSPGSRADLLLELDELVAVDGTGLLGLAVVRHGTVVIY